MHQTIFEKLEGLRLKFEGFSSREELYRYLIELGKKKKGFQDEWKCEENKVFGCQSTLYLHAELLEGKLFFYAHSDALISSGLAELLIQIYSGETPQVFLTTPPKFLEELGILDSLSMNRSNGVRALYKKMILSALHLNNCK